MHSGEAHRQFIRPHCPVSNLGLGTVGILIWGRRAGLLPCLRSALDDLVGRGQFHLGSDVYASALRTVDEIPPSS